MIIKINNFRGDLSDISAKTASLPGCLPTYYHVEGDLAVRARVVKDRSVHSDFDHALPISDMIERLVTGFEMLPHGRLKFP